MVLNGLPIFVLTAVAIFLHIHVTDGLKNMHIRVPEAVKIGDDVPLICDYDLESVALYTIKWYRDEEEFYRYVPKEDPPTKVFLMPHLTVDVSRSNSTQVTLKEVEKETSGEFKCEVSADAPLFHTDIRSARLLVAEIPKDGPILKTDIQKLTPGGRLLASCEAPSSYPPMNVSWFINDMDVQDRSGIQISNSIKRYASLIGLEALLSNITIKSTQDLFKNGKMKLKCLATLFTLYRESDEIEVIEDTPQIAPIREHSPHTHESFNKASLRGTSTTTIFYFHLYLWIRRFVSE